MKQLTESQKERLRQLGKTQRVEIDKDYLHDEYFVQLKSTEQIANLIGCSPPTVIARLKEYGFVLRTRSQRKSGCLNPMFGIRGKNNPRFGTKHSEKTIEKIKAKLPNGKNHFRYKNPEDRIEPINIQIRTSQKNKHWRRVVLKRDNYTCQICFRKRSKDVEVHVDHIKPFSKIKKEYSIDSLESAKNCDELWDPNNGRVLCKLCHEKTESWGNKGTL